MDLAIKRKFWKLEKVDWNPIRVVLSSADEEYHPANSKLTIYALGYRAEITLPNFLRPYKKWVDTSKESWSTGPNSGFWDRHPCEYGFSIHEGFLQIFYGAQTHDSISTKSWSVFLPWTQWRHVRVSLYAPDGAHYWSQFGNGKYDELSRQEELCPSVRFLFSDYDGEHIEAKAQIQEREWRFGEGYFKWLSLFRRPMVRRTLDLEFSKETGPRKGSWKGGTIGHGIEMLPEESVESAFRRYCAQNKMTFIGVAA